MDLDVNIEKIRVLSAATPARGPRDRRDRRR